MLGISDTQYDRFADGFDSSDIVGIPLSTSVDHISPDIAVWGRGYYATGDTYRIDAISRTGIDRALEIITYPSPRMGYVVTAPAPSSSWVVVDTGYGDRRIGDTIGLAVLGAVCNQVSMQTWNGTTWTDQLSLSMQTTIGTGYIRSSNTDVWFRPNSTNNNSKYYRQDELVGCLLSVNDGVDSIIAEIISNTEGQFSTSSGTRQMAILAKAFPMSGSYTSLDLSATTGGTVSIIHRDALIIGTQTASARYYRFFLSAILNKLEIGKLIPLRVSLLARQSGPGDQYSHSSNDEIISMPYGFDRSRRLAPAGRNWRFPFRQLISTQNRHNGGTTVNAVAITGSTPRATSDNNLDQLISVVETAGQSTPIVFVSQLDVTSDLTTAVTLLGKNKWMYGRVEDSITATMGRGYRYGDKSTYDVDFSIKEIV
jgi:hypothetical protein